MSVPASRRKETQMQFVETAKNISSDMLSYVVRMPKRLQHHLADPMFESTVELVKHVEIANRTYVKDQLTYDLRRKHLLESLGMLDTIQAYLDIYWRHFIRGQNIANRGTFSDEKRKYIKKSCKKYQGFAKQIISERRLIRGVMNRDTKVCKEKYGLEVGSNVE